MEDFEVKLIKEIRDFIDTCYITEDSQDGNSTIVETFYERWLGDEQIQEAIEKLED